MPDCGVITKLRHLICRFNLLIMCDTWVAKGEYQALEAFLLSLEICFDWGEEEEKIWLCHMQLCLILLCQVI